MSPALRQADLWDLVKQECAKPNRAVWSAIGESTVSEDLLRLGCPLPWQGYFALQAVTPSGGLQ